MVSPPLQVTTQSSILSKLVTVLLQYYYSTNGENWWFQNESFLIIKAVIVSNLSQTPTSWSRLFLFILAMHRWVDISFHFISIISLCFLFFCIPYMFLCISACIDGVVVNMDLNCSSLPSQDSFSLGKIWWEAHIMGLLLSCISLLDDSQWLPKSKNRITIL